MAPTDPEERLKKPMAPTTRKVPEPAAPELESRPSSEPDARSGETASQDVAPTEEDIRLEALQKTRSTDPPDVEAWRDANRRVEPGLEDIEREPPAVRGPRNDDGRGHVVLEDDTVADRGADADAVEREADDANARDDT